MSETAKIFVRLINEAVDVWRPVRAVHLDADAYLIVDQPYDPTLETWQFDPGSSVICRTMDLGDGPVLVAVESFSQG